MPLTDRGIFYVDAPEQEEGEEKKDEAEEKKSKKKEKKDKKEKEKKEKKEKCHRRTTSCVQTFTVGLNVLDRDEKHINDTINVSHLITCRPVGRPSLLFQSITVSPVPSGGADFSHPKISLTSGQE
jgi:hypothetical protein